MKKFFFILALIPSLLFADNIQVPYSELSVKKDPHWEQIKAPDYGSFSVSAIIHRAAVPHGWLVSTGFHDVTVVFVPDENHEWLM